MAIKYIYPIAIKYILETAIKCTNIFHYIQDTKKYPNWDFWSADEPSGNPGFFSSKSQKVEINLLLLLQFLSIWSVKEMAMPLWKMLFGNPTLKPKLWVWSFIHSKKQLFSLIETAMRLRSQRPLHVHGDAGHLVNKVVDKKKNNRKSGRPRRRRGTRGRWPKKLQFKCRKSWP
jgi:hypothetical protein